MNRPVKTSLTHPLEIAAVSTPSGGQIGLSMCPGKRQPDAITGPWDRDLAADLDRVVAFGATHLITLMETAELDGAATPVDVLREAVARRGLRWLHWPIVDFQAPESVFEHAWRENAGAVCAQLSTGGRIVVHCRGGRGRSGLVAARLLIELGVPTETAILHVRAVQPLAIETKVQDEHVRAFIPVLELRANAGTY